MQALFSALARTSIRFRWLVVLAWLLFAVVASTAFPTLASVTKPNNTDFLPASTPSLAAARLATPLQSVDLTPVPVVVAAQGRPLGPADDAYLTALTARLRQVPDVRTVRDIGRSPDGQADQLQVLGAVSRGQQGPVTALVDGLRAGLRDVAAPPGVSAHLAGPLVTQVDGRAQAGSSGNRVQELSLLFIVVLLVLIFRSPLAPLVTLLPAFLVSQVAGRVVAEATKAGLQVSQLSQLMLIVLVLGAGTDYGLFLVFRVREELAAGLTPHEAVVRAVERVGESITFSALTVIAALLSLLAATFGVYSSLGAPLAIGIGLMLVAALTLLPALLAIGGRTVFWPVRTRSGPRRTGVWSRLSARIVRQPVATLVAGLVLFGGLAGMSAGYTASGFGSTENAPAGTDSAAGNALLAQHYPRSSANPTQVVLRLRSSAWDDPQVLEQARAGLAASGVFSTVTGPTNPNGIAIAPAQLTALHRALGDPASANPALAPPQVPAAAVQLYRTLGQLISPDGETVQYLTSLVAGDPGTTRALDAVPAIRAAVTAVANSVGAQDWGVAGQAPAIYDVSSVSNRDLTRIVPLAIVVIGVLLAAVTRSLVAPLYLIASVALSYLAALGLAVLAFQVIEGASGLTFILPFLMFLFLLALGEDYNILVMTRIREEAQALPIREAVGRALTATGTTVTSAGLVLAGTFAVFAIAGGSSSGGSQFRDIGTGLAAGILMDTFLVRTLLVPSTVVLLGRWNWWPSRLHRATHHDQRAREPVVRV